MIDERILIWSPKFRGSKEAWEWVADASNGRTRPPPELTEEQKRDAYNCGYLNASNT